MLSSHFMTRLLSLWLCLIFMLPLQAITIQEEIDLELFESRNQTTPTVFTLIDRTRTACGAQALKNLLQNPLTNQTDLESRQRCIQYLVEQPELLEALDAQLLLFKKNEYALQAIWQPEDPIKKLMLDEFYFTWDYLKKYNNNPALLNLLQVAHVGNLFAPVLEHVVLHFFISGALKKSLGMQDCCNDHDHHMHDIHDHSPHHSEWSLLYKIYNIAHLGVHAMGIKGLVDHICQKAILLKNIQGQLIDACAAIRSMQILASHIIACQQLKKEIDASLVMQEISDNKELMNLLNKGTFIGTASYLSNVGNILACRAILRQAKSLQNTMAVVGQLDALVSIAKLYREFRDKEAHYSFANYESAHVPHIDIQNFWHPQVGFQTCVANSLQAGDEQPRTLIITGANGAGKSTTLRSLALVILFGQTLTIVPAFYAQFTPFEHILTSMTHTDNIGNGNSLFAAELLKANEFVERLRQADHKRHFIFAVFDELFKSTMFAKGQQTALSFVNHIGTYPKCITLVATHYPQLIHLASCDPNVFKNYVMQLDAHHKGKATYELIPGNVEQAQVFDVLEHRGIEADW